VISWLSVRRLRYSPPSWIGNVFNPVTFLNLPGCCRYPASFSRSVGELLERLGYLLCEDDPETSSLATTSLIACYRAATEPTLSFFESSLIPAVLKSLTVTFLKMTIVEELGRLLTGLVLPNGNALYPRHRSILLHFLLSLLEGNLVSLEVNISFLRKCRVFS
jgi:hypothetical protein